MSCKILDPDWSFEVAEDGYVHALKSYMLDNNGYLVSPYKNHRPQNYFIQSNRDNIELKDTETFSIGCGFHAYLYSKQSIIGIKFPIIIKPQDIVMVGSFGSDISIVAMDIEILKEIEVRGEIRYIEKDKHGLKMV